MDGDGAIVGLVDATSTHVWLKLNITHQMPVDWVASQTERLSNIEELMENNDKHNDMIDIYCKYLLSWRG